MPQNWDQLGIWLLTQFPVLGVTGFTVWWVLRWTEQQEEKRNTRLHNAHEAVVAEKERLIIDKEKQNADRIADRNERISELKGEIEKLSQRLSRRRKPDKAGEGGENT